MISVRTYDLQLRYTFTISRGSQQVVPILVLQLEHEGITGTGETCPSGYYGQSVDSVRRDLENLLPWIEQQDPNDYSSFLTEAAVRLNNPQALCALDLA